MAKTRRHLRHGQLSPQEQLHTSAEVDFVTKLPGGETPYDPAVKPIWEVFEELAADIPQVVLDRLPADGAAQHDHYIYGVPKKPQ